MSAEQLKLGTVITGPAYRDAVHVAVLPVTAGEALAPGARVAVDEGGAVARWSPAPVGIVDPFLGAPVKAGERFYLCLFPGTITALRHAWAHPALPDDAAAHGDGRAVVLDAEQSRAFRELAGGAGVAVGMRATQITEADRDKLADVARSMTWIENLGKQVGRDYGGIMRDAAAWVATRRHVVDDSWNYQEVSAARWAEFWAHHAVVTGTAPPADLRVGFYTCPC